MLCVSLTKKFRIIHSPRSFPAIIYNVGWGSGGVGGEGGGGWGVVARRVLQILKYEKWCSLCEFKFQINHHTGDYVPYSLRTVWEFLNVPQKLCVQGLSDGADGLSSLSEKVKLGNTMVCLCPLDQKRFSHILQGSRGHNLIPSVNPSNMYLLCVSSQIIIQPVAGGMHGDHLPVAHTCFNLLDLPRYPSTEMMRTKLSQAVEYSTGFGLA